MHIRNRLIGVGLVVVRVPPPPDPSRGRPRRRAGPGHRHHDAQRGRSRGARCRRGRHRVPADQLDRPPARHRADPRSPDSGKAGDAVKSYEIAIQFGAILAVLVLYRRRLRVDGRRAGRPQRRRARARSTSVAIAFVPAAIVGVVAEKVIKDVLFGAWPVVVAWIVGGVAVIASEPAGRSSARGRPRARRAHDRATRGRSAARRCSRCGRARAAASSPSWPRCSSACRWRPRSSSASCSAS